MQQQYPSILIIYNPFSTSGRAKQKAVRLTRQLKRKGFVNVKLRKSEFPGHSEQLAYEEAKREQNPLIISVSGDGGYHEVVNGALRAQSTDKKVRPICAILAAGHANDHRKAVSKRSLLWAIVHTEPEPVDVLRLSFANTHRFAHSYIGIGASANAAAAINAEHLSRWQEIRTIAKSLINFHHFSITVDGKTRTLDSLIFANINRMSKVLRIGNKTNLQSGTFNLSVVPHRTRFKFFYLLFKTIVFGVKNPPQYNSYKFSLQKSQPIQLDGETMVLPSKTSITVSAEPGLLMTIH